MSTYEKEIKIVEGSIGEVISLQAQKEDTSEGVDLTGCTVKWHIYKSEADKLRLQGDCAEVDLGVGKVSYTTKADDWATNRLVGGEDYQSSLVADRADPLFHKEFPSLLVKIVKKAPTELES